MPNPPRPARSYDEIVRQTVPELDSSFRPTEGQEKAAYEGARALDADEQQLHDRVVAALSGNSDASGVAIEVERTRVTLRGRVPSANALTQIENRVHDVNGVGVVASYLVIGPA
jgi:osmotically-inducible protein OsmY